MAFRFFRWRADHEWPAFSVIWTLSPTHQRHQLKKQIKNTFVRVGTLSGSARAAQSPRLRHRKRTISKISNLSEKTVTKNYVIVIPWFVCLHVEIIYELKTSRLSPMQMDNPLYRHGWASVELPPNRLT